MNCPKKSCHLLYIVILSIILLNACTTVPESDFYETDGILVIYTNSLGETENWIDYQSGSINSRIHSADQFTSGSLQFPFYLQNPGSYEIWFLLKHDTSHSADLNEFGVMVYDDSGFLQHQTGGVSEREDLYHWSPVYRDQSLDRVYFSDPGFYRIELNAPGGKNLSVIKMQMISDPLNRPSGLGLPETDRFDMDPILTKREQRVPLPPSWNFGVLEGGIERALARKTEWLNINPDILFPGYVMREIPEVPDLGQQRVDGLKNHIDIVSNPLLLTYEYPFALWPVDLTDTEKFNEMPVEKRLRWIQFQAFNSVMNSFDPDLWDFSSSDQEIYFNKIEELKNFRKRLFPYIYSLAHLASRTGERIVKGSSNYPGQFSLGEAFLIAPADEEGLEEMFVYLPDGEWYDYRSGTPYRGGQSWLIEVSDIGFPLFRRAGSIVPFRVEPKDVLDGNNSELIIEVATGAPGTFRLYEDDGLTTQYLQGEFSTTAFRYFEHEGYATFTIGRMVRGYSGQPSKKTLTLKFIYSRQPVSVKANETELEKGKGLSQWYYDESEQSLIVNWNQPNDVKTDFIIRF